MSLENILNFKKRTLSNVLGFGKKTLDEVLNFGAGASGVALSEMSQTQSLRGSLFPKRGTGRGFGTPASSRQSAGTLGSRVIAPFIMGASAYRGARNIMKANSGLNKDIEAQIKSEDDLFKLRQRAIRGGNKINF